MANLRSLMKKTFVPLRRARVHSSSGEEWFGSPLLMCLMVCEHLVADLMDGLLNKWATILYTFTCNWAVTYRCFPKLRLLMATFVSSKVIPSFLIFNRHISLNQGIDKQGKGQRLLKPDTALGAAITHFLDSQCVIIRQISVPVRSHLNYKWFKGLRTLTTSVLLHWLRFKCLRHISNCMLATPPFFPVFWTPSGNSSMQIESPLYVGSRYLITQYKEYEHINKFSLLGACLNWLRRDCRRTCSRFQ